MTDLYWRIRIWWAKQRVDDLEDIVAYGVVGIITIATAVLCCSCVNRPARLPYKSPGYAERDGISGIDSGSVSPVQTTTLAAPKIPQAPRAILPVDPTPPNEDDPWY